MRRYEAGDKVVVKLYGQDAECLNADEMVMFGYEQILGKLEDLQPKQEKIKFTPEMKREFDGLKTSCADLNIALSSVKGALSNWLNHNKTKREDDEHQYLFALAWHNQSLIEVIEPEVEKHYIPLGLRTTDGYMQFLSCPKNSGEHRTYFASRKDMKLIQKFSLDEVKNIKNAFPNIDLISIWEGKKELY